MTKLLPVAGIIALALLGQPISRLLNQQNWSSSSTHRNSGQDTPGDFSYYALVLSWSPTYCADEGQGDNQQCNRRDGRRYAFVMHGLWPQYERGYPSNCRLNRRPFVPEPVIDRMLDIMPSKRLVIHEYRAHGTCSGLDPESYFSTARRMFDRVVIPARFRNPTETQSMSPAEIRNAFLSANKHFDASMLAVVCDRRDGDLKEIRFCFTKQGEPRSCGRNENKQKLCSASRVTIPPTR
jgi:ribonuclease T2